jgi:hypothetical protein
MKKTIKRTDRVKFDIYFWFFKLILPLNLLMLHKKWYQKFIRKQIRKVERKVEFYAIKSNPNLR